ncbi:zf-CCHC domain-containing protein [Tanacetum coccineum]|uniref:Zf-CCHC domain-containing protein n=1 Tax=Tanacetum coccineum TaxID=301880 RepID=A0ABQ5G044_9ASTR
MIEESKNLTSLSLDELIGNLKVHEMIIKKDSKIVKAKGERRSLALKTKKESSDEECSTFGSEDEEYAMAVRDFRKFFKRRGRFVSKPRNDKKTFQRSREDKNCKSDRKCFRCGDPNHLIRECPKPPKDKNQRALVGGSWSDSDDIILDSEYNMLCKMSLKIITKNKHQKAISKSLENEISELKEKLSKLERKKGVDLECTTCQILRFGNEKLKEEALKLTRFQKSTRSLNKIFSIQKPFGDKSGLGFNSFEASTSETKETKFVKSQNETSSGGGPTIAEGGPHNAQTTHKANQGPSELVRKLPKLKFDQHFYDACKIGKQAHASHKAKNIVSTTRCLELLHMDLFGPSSVRSYRGNLYTLVIVDDYSRIDKSKEMREPWLPLLLMESFLCVNVVLLAMLVSGQSSVTSVGKLGIRQGTKVKQEEAGEVHGRAYAIKDAEPQGSDRSFVNTRFSSLLDIKPIEIEDSYEVELVDGRLVSTNTVVSPKLNKSLQPAKGDTQLV